MHYFKRNIGDYHKKAGRLNMLQHGAYTLLIDSCYDRERFPTREEAIEWCWASSQAEIDAVEFVLSRFFDLVDGRYIQTRIAEEIAEYHGKSEKNKKIAIEREAKRKGERERNVHETCTDEHESPPNYKPITNNHKPITNVIARTDTSAIATVEKKQSKGSRLPNDWVLPRDWGNWALERGLSRDDVLLEAETFRNYWVAKTGKDAAKADWEATWRNWVIRATKDRPKTYYELTREAKERDADKRLTGLASADMATLEALGLARDGRILGS